MNTKKRWKFMGADTPQGLDPSVDGQRCWLFMDTNSKGPEWYVIPVTGVLRMWGW